MGERPAEPVDLVVLGGEPRHRHGLERFQRLDPIERSGVAMEQGFFEPGRLYRRRAGDPTGDWEIFLVAHVGRPPGGFAAPDDRGPVAFGWRRAGGPGSGRPLGPFTTSTVNGWSDITDSDLVRLLGLTDDGSSGGWQNATAAPSDTGDSSPGGRRDTDPAADTSRSTEDNRRRGHQPPH
ncbi:hypothetical protein [Kitasatospora camelliae]|uniref:Uncharacterized protein n=1 Tax=Kitasatospora camelliae TaxID=3156397 RepID=A0AAU8K8H4_9ACTN